MATKKVTVTLDAAQVDQIRSLVEAGTASSVSGFVQHAVAVALDDDRYAAGDLMSGVTFDAGALIALDRDDRRVVVLLARARETGAQVTVPASALAQAVRRPERQARLSRLIRQPTTPGATAWTG
jgi:Arc/MetJ-type ribon-helix-helix transcriptional regulator